MESLTEEIQMTVEKGKITPSSGQGFTKLCESLFSWSLFLALPSLVFHRGMNARCIEIGALSYLCLLFLGKRQITRDGKAAVAGILFIASFAFSLFFGNPEQKEFGIFYPLLSYGVALFFFSKELFSSKETWTRLAWSFWLTAALISVDVLSQSIFGVGILSRSGFSDHPDSVGRVLGPFSNPNHLVLIPICMSSFWLLRPAVQAKGFFAWRNLLFLGSAVLCVLAMAISGSRNVWMLGGILVALFAWDLARWKGIGLAGAGLVIALIALPQGQKLIDRMQHEIQVRPARFTIWTETVQFWQAHPIWGIGPKQFPETYRQRWREAAKVEPLPTKARLAHPHQIYLEILVELGIVGFLAFSFFIYSCLTGWKQAFARTAERRQFFFVGTALGLLMFTGLFDFSFYFRWYCLTFFLLMGLALSLSRESSTVSESAA